MICKILAFFILPYLVISFKMDKKPAFKVITGELANSIDAIQANDQKAVEINGHPIRSPPIQAKSLNNVTLESSDRNECRDLAGTCAYWKEQRGCDYSFPNWKNWFQTECKKTCGYCTGEGNKCAKIPSWMMNALNFNSRIVGGKEALRPIPWQVSVGGRCGGTILDEYTILTAGHCNIVSDDYILAGALSLKNHQFTDPPPQTISVKNVIRHHYYEDFITYAKYDYSIVKLREPLTFNNNVQPACLPNSANFDIRDSALASGWGSKKSGNGLGPYPDKLRYVGLPILAPSECFTNTKLFLCAGSRLDGKGVCKGDSGGPLVVPRSKSDDTAIVIGISSFVTSDSNGDCRLSVFAPVTSVLKWIKANMEKP